jgi:hypothetical protein
VRARQMQCSAKVDPSRFNALCLASLLLSSVMKLKLTASAMQVEKMRVLLACCQSPSDRTVVWLAQQRQCRINVGASTNRISSSTKSPQTPSDARKVVPTVLQLREDEPLNLHVHASAYEAAVRMSSLRGARVLVRKSAFAQE